MWRRRRVMQDLDADIRDHLARETEENIARGMAPDEARRRAQVTFGSVALARENTERVWAWAWLDRLRQDVRHAGRTLRRNRTFAATAAATLALAIGANTLMFSVLNAVVLRPLPYRSPEQLAMLWTENPAQNVRVVQDEVEDDPDAQPVGLPHQPVEVRLGPEPRVDAGVVADVVADVAPG